MAITSITIENFKGIGDAVTIPIRPITLLFGKNSSGKSTVLQALLYMRELFLRFHQGYLFDIQPEYRPLENIPIDLGDFPSLVHRHDLNRKIRIRLEFDLSYASKLEYNSAEIELVVGWDETQDISSVESYIYALNGEECFYALNDKGKSHQTDKGQQLHQLNQWWGIGYSRHDGKHDKEGYRYFVNRNSSIVKEAKEDYMIPSEFNKIMRGGELSYVREKLNGIRYLGPIREVPPRNYLVSQMYNESRWVTGLEAWDALARDSELAEKVNRYAQKLALGYRFPQSDEVPLDMDGEIVKNLKNICSSDEYIEVDRLKEQVLDPLELLHRQHPILLQDENSGIEVHPLDVGFGISQVFPVLVGVLDQGYHSPKMFAIEQPELHVHPALQVGLGDLFIDGIQNSDRIMLVETHSEHLLLRLLRRVHETSSTRVDTKHKLTPSDLSVVYVQPTPTGAKFTPVSVTDDGDFDEPWPEGFFEERDSELFYHA